MRGISSRSLYSLSRSLLSRVSHGITVATSGGCSGETRALGSLWSALQSRGVKVNAIQLRPGNVIERTGRTFRVVESEHKQQGRGGASIQVELRDVDNGSKLNLRFGPEESVEKVFVQEKSFTCLYTEGDTAFLIEPDTFEQVEVPLDIFGKAAVYLKEEMRVQLQLYDGRALSASVPKHVTCTIQETQLPMKGLTSAPRYKRALLDNGSTIQVPSYLEAGEKIVINTEDDSFVKSEATLRRRFDLFSPPRRDLAISVASVREHSTLLGFSAVKFVICFSEFDIWSVKRIAEWRPCKWWLHGHLTPLPAKSNGFIRVDCFGGLNQMRRDVSVLDQCFLLSHKAIIDHVTLLQLCDGVGIARLLNATLVLPKFEVAAYWNESSGFGDVFDVDYFIQKMNGFIKVVKDLPTDISSKEPFRVDCSKRKGQFDYRETILPLLLEHHYISLTPAMSQRRDRYMIFLSHTIESYTFSFSAFAWLRFRYPQYAKATLCQACYSALRLTTSLEKKALELLDAIPKPFLSLHLRFEPDMVAYSRCEYPNLSPSSLAAIKAAGGEDKKPWTGEIAQSWRKRGKCPLTPNETALMLQSLRIPTSTNIYLAAGDGLMEMEGFTSVYTQVFTKSALLNREDFTRMHGNTKAALDYYVSINSDAYVATYFGNMDKMVAAMRAYNGMHKTLFLSRKAFAELSSQGLEEEELKKALWEVHRNDFEIGRGSALPDCFCEFKL
ncbi:unnamed protein product [Brassica oleracea]|uniref:O-fucosyltransferase family protein n=1 Tax=Brassica napus TaxID=3708 RepID=A0A816KZT0_BRANA|nr:unnamed protein product [Brassica napus]